VAALTDELRKPGAQFGVFDFDLEVETGSGHRVLLSAIL
jgi:hypothetical protein